MSVTNEVKAIFTIVVKGLLELEKTPLVTAIKPICLVFWENYSSLDKNLLGGISCLLLTSGNSSVVVGFLLTREEVGRRTLDERVIGVGKLLLVFVVSRLVIIMIVYERKGVVLVRVGIGLKTQVDVFEPGVKIRIGFIASSIERTLMHRQSGYVDSVVVSFVLRNWVVKETVVGLVVVLEVVLSSNSLGEMVRRVLMIVVFSSGMSYTLLKGRKIEEGIWLVIDVWIKRNWLDRGTLGIFISLLGKGVLLFCTV